MTNSVHDIKDDVEKGTEFRESVSLPDAVRSRFRKESEGAQVQSLGTTRLKDENGGQILVPTPSTDPNDPLYWSQAFKYYVLVLLCVAIMLANFVAAGPSIGIVTVALQYTGSPAGIPTVAYFFTATALVQGLCTIIWMPLINRYGRRPAYILSSCIFSAGCIWAALTNKSYSSHMGARILIGLGGGATECLAPVTIADIFFVHERGFAMSTYSSFLGSGMAIGLIVDGAIFLRYTYEDCYWVALALVATTLVLVIFTLPESAFRRDAASLANPRPRVTSHFGKLRVFNGVYTQESIGKMMVRPLGLMLLPAVLWSSCVFGSQLGFLVAISSTMGTPYAKPPWLLNDQQIGYLWFSGIAGCLVGIYAGGSLNDWVMNKLTVRNGGMFEPEFRLPALLPALFMTPVALCLYGVGVQKELHWVTVVISLFFLYFTIVIATNVTLTYCVDILKPVAGETVIAILVLKSIVGFVIAVEANTWIGDVGALNAYGTMAGISVACLLPGFVFYTHGKQMRQASMKWRLTSWVKWDQDREDYHGGH